MKYLSLQFRYIIFLSVFAVPLIYNPWGGINQYELPKQAFLISFLGLFLIILIIELWRRSAFKISVNKTVLIVSLLWLFSYLVSTLLSIAPTESFWGTYDRMHGLINIFFLALFFVLCLQILSDSRLQKIFFRITFVCGLLVSIYAISQALGWDPFRASAPLVFAGRSFATLGSPTELGQFLIFPVFIAFFLMLENRKDKKLAILLACAFLLMLAALFLTKNRASILAVGCALLLFLFVKSQIGRTKKAMIAFVIICAAAGFFYFFAPDLRSLGTRSVLWLNSIGLIPSHLVFGSGLETYYQRIQTVLPSDLYMFERMSDIPDRAHNEVLDIAVTRGLIGMILYLFNIVFLGYLLFKKRIKGTVGFIALFSIIAYTISMQFGFSSTVHFVFLLAMWALLLGDSLKFSNLKIAFPKSIKVLVCAVLVVAGSGLIAFSVRNVETDMFFKQGVKEYILYGEAAALRLFERAINLNPYYGYLHRSAVTLTYKYAAADKEIIPKLENQADKLGEITNQSFHYELAKAEIETAKGNKDAAEIYFNNAARKAPNWAVLWEEWGRIAFDNKNYENAANKFEKLISLAPPYWKFGVDLEKRTADERQKYMIFYKSNQGIMDALGMLAQSYEKLNRIKEAESIWRHLILLPIT